VLLQDRASPTTYVSIHPALLKRGRRAKAFESIGEETGNGIGAGCRIEGEESRGRRLNLGVGNPELEEAEEDRVKGRWQHRKQFADNNDGSCEKKPEDGCCAVRCAMVLYAVPLVSSLWLQGSVYLISMVPRQPWFISRAPHSIVSQSIIIHNRL